MASNPPEADKIFALQENDVIEMFAHRFRLEYVARDEMGRAIVPKNARLGRKSLRMSLVRAAVGEVARGAPPLQESQAALEESEEDGELDDNKADALTTEQDKENAPVIKARRSYALHTPARERSRNGPWESEPRKKSVKRLSMSPVKGAAPAESSLGSPVDGSRSIVVMEEVDDPEVEEETQPENKVEEEAEPIAGNDSVTAGDMHTTPARDTAPPTYRLTQSSSPKKSAKKARRRSSFFGRAGIFAGMNLGFYPEERRDKEEAKAVERELQESAIAASLSAAITPNEVRKPITPEPRLDSYGMPRLPRSMSSPSGLNYGSPGKRRVISLRTATLIKTGQQTFEQRKLLSPPASPTKTFSSPSLMAPFIVSPSLEKKAAAGQIPLPDSDDEGDADEVDRSLSSFADEEDEEKTTAPPPPRFTISKPRTIGRSRKSQGVLSTQTADMQTKSNGRGRTSLPGKLLSVPAVERGNEKAVEEWRKEWEGGGAEGGSGEGIEVAQRDAFDQAQDEDTEGEMEVADAHRQEDRAAPAADVGTACPLKEAGSPLKMLRHMVGANLEMTTLLDRFSGDDATQDPQDAYAKGVALSDVADDQVMEEDEQVVVEECKPVREEIPIELTAAASNKLSRRASELPLNKTRRRSSVAHKSQPKRARKSCAAVLHTKEEEQAPAPEEPSLPTKGVVVTSLPRTRAEFTGTDSPHVEVDLVGNERVEEEREESARPAAPVQVASVPKQSPRKRAVEATQTGIPIAARPARSAKVAASIEASSSIDQPASAFPQKKISRRGKVATSSAKGHSDEVSLDTIHSSQLVLEQSSPVKRTKRAAREQAETKIRNVLVKKPSTAVLRDAKSLSEAGPSKASTRPSDEIKARLAATRAAQAPSRKASKDIVQSEPTTRTTRSRAAAKR